MKKILIPLSTMVALIASTTFGAFSLGMLDDPEVLSIGMGILTFYTLFFSWVVANMVGDFIVEQNYRYTHTGTFYSNRYFLYVGDGEINPAPGSGLQIFLHVTFIAPGIYLMVIWINSLNG